MRMKGYMGEKKSRVNQLQANSMQWTGSLRKASNVLRPSVKPFFSPKAASSKPWSAKPFIGTN